MVAMLHDGLANAAVSDDVWTASCKQYKVVCYDRRGYGRTVAPDAKYSPSEDLAALLKHLGITKASFIGSSAGGSIVVEFTLRSPQSIDKLVLVGAAIPGYPISSELIDRLKNFIAAMNAGNARAATAATAAIRANLHLIAPGNTNARAKLRAIRNADHAIGGGGEQVRNNEAMKRVGKIRAPTLVLISIADDPQNIAQAEALKVVMSNARLKTIAGTGHLPYLEAPEIFLTTVTGFLN